MIPPSRGTILLGAGATAASALLPAFAGEIHVPPTSIVRANGIDLAVRDVGDGPAVVLLHGFPGLSYTWRHQIPVLAAAGYRVLAPDLRGYGGSDAPAAVEAYDVVRLTADLVGLLDALGIERAVFTGHDWGGLLVWQMALLHRERVAGAISLNTPFVPHWMLWLHPDLVAPALAGRRRFTADPQVDPIAQMRSVYSPDMYVLMFQDGSRADDAMNAAPRASLRNSYRKDLMTADEWNHLPPEVANMEYYGKPIPARLPGRDVLGEFELEVFVEGYRRHGFTPPINWYRNLTRNWRAGLNVDQTVRVPSLMISSANDVVLRPSMTDGMAAVVPDLERRVVSNSWHWTPEDSPGAANRLMVDWLRRRYPASAHGRT